MAVQWLTVADTFDPTSKFAPSAVEFASFLMHNLTAGKFPGIHTTTESYTSMIPALLPRSPQVVHGQIYNLPAHVASPTNLRLRNTPVLSVQSITQGDVTLDPSTYSIRNNAYLRRSGGVPWVLDPSLELLVTYTWGTNPPAAGVRAATRLANELILNDLGSPECALPQRLMTVNRQGLSYSFVDPQQFLDNGRIGIPEIDFFLAAVNPHKVKQKSRMFSVDRPRGEKIN
jgi:hypothetical protein